MKTRRPVVPVLAVIVAGCAPDFDFRGSTVSRERVLAVIAEPAEAKPGDVVSYTVIAAGPDGPISDPVATLSYCDRPKPLVENGSVAAACVAAPLAPFPPLVDAHSSAPVPRDACRLHGPDPPPGDFRPRDPDATGGYYQPLRVDAFGDTAFHLERLRCNTPDVAADVARDFAERYVVNHNPSGLSLSVGSSVASLEPGQSVDVTVSLGQAARERYVVVDQARQRVVERTESLRFDFFVTAGVLGAGHLTLPGDVPDPGHLSVSYRAPATSGPAHLWVLAHDDRGGTAVLEQPIIVE